MPERVQPIQDAAQIAATATYTTGAATIGISLNSLEWLHEYAWLVSMIFMVMTFVVMLVFRLLEYRLKLKAEERAKIDFRRRHSDIYKEPIDDPDRG